MASDVSNTYLRGLGIPSAVADLDALQGRGTGNTDSKYQEASPVAGVPEAVRASHMALEATGTPSQEAELLITAHRAGNPGLERAGYYWSDQSAASPVDYGWDAPSLVTGWETLWFTSLPTAHTGRPRVIRLLNGDLLCIAVQASTVSAPISPHYYTASTSTWADLSDLTLDDPATQKGCGLLQLPSGRVLLFVQSSSNDQVDVYYNDDVEGDAAWAIYSRRVLDEPPATADILAINVCYSGGEILMVVEWDDGSNLTASVYGSNSLGASFTQTDDDWNNTTGNTIEAVRIVAGSDGGFIVGYAKVPLSSAYKTRRLASAMGNLSAQDEVDLGGGNSAGYSSLALWRDECGLLYSIRFDATNSGVGVIARSDDDGRSWTDFGKNTKILSLHEGDTTDRFEYWDAVDTGGRTALVSRWTASSANEDGRSVGVIFLGGYSTHTAPSGGSGINYRDTDQIAYNTVGAGSALGGIYLPIELPGNVNWGTSGTASTEDLVSPGVLNLGTTGGYYYYSRDLVTTSGAYAWFVEFAVQLNTTGSTTADVVSVRIETSDGSSDEHQCHIRLSSTGYAVYDKHGDITLGTTSADFTSRVWVRVALDADGDVLTWYCEEADHGQFRKFTAGAGGALTPSGLTGNNRIFFGHLGTGTEDSEWSSVGYCCWPGTWGPASSSFGDSWTSPDDLHPRSFSATPQLVHDGIKVAAKSGPAKIGDSWTVKQDADHAAANMLWQVNPSPRAQWRHTTAENETIFSFDMFGIATATKSHLMGSTRFVAMLNTNIRQGVLESSTDGASWTTQITLDARTDFDGLRFTRNGDVIAPEKGGASHKAGRYINEGELVGGTVKFTGTSDYREILENTGGAWTDEGAAVPYIRCRDIDDGEGATGACEFWAPNVVGYKHELGDFHRYWRLRIPSQVTAQGDYRLGQLVFGHVHVFGMQYGRGWSVSVEPQWDIETLRSGSTRARKMGKALRQIEIGWTDGSDATQAQASDPVPDYVTGSSSGIPLASRGDEIRRLQGLALQHGADPVLFLPRINRTTDEVIVTDPDLWLWGRIESPATRTNVLGDEDVSELDRLDAITIREIG